MYNVKEVAEMLQCSDRSVRRYVKSLVNINKNGGLEMSEDIIEILKKQVKKEDVRTGSGQVRTTSDIEVEYDIIEGFSHDEYEEFKKRLTEYPIMQEHITTLLNQLDYMRKSGESKDRQMELLLQNIRERNLIEAKEKRLTQ